MSHSWSGQSLDESPAHCCETGIPCNEPPFNYTMENGKAYVPPHLKEVFAAQPFPEER